jgi:D-proline reductase (dithiol) PrdB
VGLIAREIESRGIPTLSFSSAWSITAAVRPPRAVYLDFPLGHTAGKPNDDTTNQAIMCAALAAFPAMTEPGVIVRLPFEWDADDAWKDTVMRPRSPGQSHSDQRIERAATPQYQNDEDRNVAERLLARGGCAGCVWIE